MDYDYGKVESLPEAEFKQKLRDCQKGKQFTQSDESDIKRIEGLLDLRRGVLAKENLGLEKYDCKCGRRLTFYDFVFTSIVDAGHPKYFIVQTLLGSKFIINRPRRLRCSACGEPSPLLDYQTPQYGCCN